MTQHRGAVRQRRRHRRAEAARRDARHHRRPRCAVRLGGMRASDARARPRDLGGDAGRAHRPARRRHLLVDVGRRRGHAAARRGRSPRVGRSGVRSARRDARAASARSATARTTCPAPRPDRGEPHAGDRDRATRRTGGAPRLRSARAGSRPGRAPGRRHRRRRQLPRRLRARGERRLRRRAADSRGRRGSRAAWPRSATTRRGSRSATAWPGSRRPGATRTRSIVKASRAVAVPDAVDDDTAAAALLQGMTAHYLQLGDVSRPARGHGRRPRGRRRRGAAAHADGEASRRPRDRDDVDGREGGARPRGGRRRGDRVRGVRRTACGSSPAARARRPCTTASGSRRSPTD